MISSPNTRSLPSTSLPDFTPTCSSLAAYHCNIFSPMLRGLLDRLFFHHGCRIGRAGRLGGLCSTSKGRRSPLNGETISAFWKKD